MGLTSVARGGWVQKLTRVLPALLAGLLIPVVAIAAAPAVSATPSTVLVLYSSTFAFEAGELDTFLTGLGETVDMSTSLPTGGLGSYHQVWVVPDFGPISTAEISALVAYSQAGGALGVTGLTNCGGGCYPYNASLQMVVHAILSDTAVSVSPSGEVQGDPAINSGVIDNVATVPNVLTASNVPAPAPGVIAVSNVNGPNVLATRTPLPGYSGPYAVAGVWDESDMAAGRGRLAIDMDVFSVGYSGYQPLWENLHHFLATSATPYALVKAQLDGNSYMEPNTQDPVSTAYGNYHDSVTDLASQAGVFGLDVVRSYNSDSPDGSELGVGWRGTYAQTAAADGSNVDVVLPDGREVIYVPDGSGGWVQPLEFPGVLSVVSGHYRVTFPDQEVWDFDSAGRLSGMSSWDGQTVTVSRNTDGTPASATSSLGPSLAFSYTSGVLTGVVSSDGRSVSYGHPSGQLTVTDAAGKTTVIDEDTLGRVIKVTDPSGVVTVENTYDSGGRVSAQETPDTSSTFAYDLGARTTTVTETPVGIASYGGSAPPSETLVYTHDSLGRVVSITDPHSQSTARTYDSNGWINEGTDRVGTETLANFDSEGNPTSVTDPSSGTTDYTYDSSGRPLTSVSPTSGTTAYTYTGTDRVPTTVTDQLGHVTHNVVTGGLLMSSTDPDGVVTTYGYNSLRQLTSVTDGAGEVTSTTYDSAGRVHTVTTPADTLGGAAHVTTTTYDADGRVHEVDAPDGGTTVTAYDDAGQPLTVTVTNPADPTHPSVTTNTYYPNGMLASTAAPGHAATAYTYDGFGQLRQTIEPTDGTDGGTSVTTYDVLGRVASVQDPDQVGTTAATTYDYDADGRVTATHAADGGTSSTAYDGVTGRVTSTSQTVATGVTRTTAYSYLSNGQTHTVTDPAGGVTTYGYDAMGRQTTVTDPTGITTTTVYTDGGRVHSVSTPAMSTIYGYDPAGRGHTVTNHDPTSAVADATTTVALYPDGQTHTVTDPAGLVTTDTYDTSGSRVATQTTPAGVVTTNTYDTRGWLLTNAITGEGTAVYTYNPDGTMASASDRRGNVTHYGYDALGNMVSETNPAGGIERWTYDAAGRVTSDTPPQITGQSLHPTVTTYDSTGRVATVTDPSGRVVTNSYDQAGEITGTTATDTDGTQTDTFGYDPAGRKTSATGPSGAEAWTYDAAGRVLTATEPGVRVTAYGYDTAGRLVSTVAPDGTGWTNTLDAYGRTTAVTPTARVSDSFTAPNGTAPNSSTWTVTAGVPTIQSNTLALPVSSTATNAAVSNTASADRDIHLDYTVADVTTANKATFKVGFRRTTVGDTYRVEIPTNSTTGSLIRETTEGGDVNTTLGTFTVPALSAGATRSLEFKVQGSTIAVTVWDPAAGPEPSTASFQTTDTGVTGSGTGLVAATRTSGTNTINVDNYSDIDPTNPPTPAATYTYDPDGRVLTEGLPSGSSRSWTYTAGQLTTFAQTVPSANRTTTLTYNSSGNVATESTSGATQWYTYDADAELTHISTGGGTATTWAYDNQGRRTTQTVGTAVTSYTYNEASQLTAVTPTGGTATTIGYDNAGRRTLETAGSNTVAYHYDPTGRLDLDTTTASGAVTSEAFGYDTASDITAETTTTSTSTMASILDWSQGSLPELLDWQKNGATTSLPLAPSGHPVAKTGPTIAPIGQDAYGNTMSGSAPSSVVAGRGYDQWGNPQTWATSSGLPSTTPRLGYRGELTIGPITNLRNRNYNATTGQFTSIDPLADEPATPTPGNPYHYTNNDPLNRVDPNGLHADDGALGRPSVYSLSSQAGLTVVEQYELYYKFAATHQIVFNERLFLRYQSLGASAQVREFMQMQSACDYNAGACIAADYLWSQGNNTSYPRSIPGRLCQAVSAFCDRGGANPDDTPLYVIPELATAGMDSPLDVILEGLLGAGLDDVTEAVIEQETVPQILANQLAGNAARDEIAAAIPGSDIEKSFTTDLGVRRVDVLTPQGVAIESKVGYTSLTNSIGTQIAKDEWLMANGDVNSVEWVFSKSGVTGKIGPSGPLADALEKAGIAWSTVP